MGAIADYTSERATDHAPSRLRAKWLVPTVLLYAAYCSACFYIEFMARERFQVPSSADVTAVKGRVAHLRAELARTNRLIEMNEWGPYAAYDAIMTAVVFCGISLAVIYGGRFVWRHVTRDSVFSAKTIVLGTLLIVVATVGLLIWPAIVADGISESKRTPYQVVDTGPHQR